MPSNLPGRQSITRQRRHRAGGRGTSGLTLLEIVLVLILIVAVIAGAAVVLPMFRTCRPMGPAKAQIELLSMYLVQYREDMGNYPTAPFVAGDPTLVSYADNVLYEALTNPDFGGKGKGWGAARDDWPFKSGAYRVGSATCHQFVAPWGSPYYYIAAPDYARGVRIHDEADPTPPGTPNHYGAILDPDGSDTGHQQAWQRHFGGSPPPSAFYNPTTFQIFSKGLDRKAGWNAGLEPDDVNNYGGVLPPAASRPLEGE